jgi:hypothetical protein
MKLSSNLNLFSTFLLRFLKYNFILFLCVFSINAYSQNIDANESKKQPSFNQTNIQVSELTKPSLGSLGIKTEINNLMGLNIWGNLKASEIIENLNYIPEVVTSRSLQNLLNDMYLSSSNPPSGSPDEIIKFMETRLIKIKSVGHSEKLYQLVKQLPDNEKWSLWKRWQVEFELFNVKDQEACKFINNKSKISSEDFWQMGKVFCLILDGKRDQSILVLDLMKSRGFSNQIFEDLFNYVYDEKESVNLQKEALQIKPIHLVMMDALKIPIKRDYIAHFGLEYVDLFLGLNYLTPKARSFLLDRKITYTDISIDKIIENYKSVADGNVNIDEALISYSKEPNAFNRANVWLSIISVNDDLKKAQAILQFIKLESKNRRFNEVVKLYLPILKEIDSTSLTKNLIDSIEDLEILADPNSFPDKKLANMIMLKKGYEWDLDFVLKENAWYLIPIFEKAGMIETPVNWLNYINTSNDIVFNNDNYFKWESDNNVKKFILTKSIKQASENNQKSLTILLTARLISDTPLVDFDLNSLITIRAALFKIGLSELANAITYEVMSSKIISFNS